MQFGRERDLAEEVLRDYEFSSGNRGTWNSVWEEIARYFIPQESTLFNSMGMVTDGQKRTQFMFDSTGPRVVSQCASIIESLVMPRNQKWHRVVADNDKINKDRQVKLYFESVNEALFKYRYNPRANFASQNAGVLTSTAGYGTGAMFVDSLHGDVGLRYKNIHLSGIYFRENHQGIIDQADRPFTVTARQAIQMFKGQCPEQIVKIADKYPDQKFTFIHAVRPNNNQEPDRVDYRGMAFSSLYVSQDFRELVAEGGFNVMPYAVLRYRQIPGEIYGRGPAHDVLPSAKTLNEQKKALLKQIHRSADPILLVSDDGVMDTVNLRPGAVNFGGVSADGRPLVHTLPVGNFQITKEGMEEEKRSMEDAFLVTVMQILQENPQMTATEVIERTKEKNILLSPTVGRVQTEYCGPMIEREIDLLTTQGLLPPMPPLLREAKGEFKITYDSPLSRAMRSEEASGLMRTMETVLNVVNVTQDPSPLDIFNWDLALPEIAEIQGVPYRWMNGDDKIAAIRAGRAKNAEDQKAIQAAPAAAAMVKANAVAKEKA